MPLLHTHFLPKHVSEADLAASQCVVIDVLRATTTIVAALATGAQSVAVCQTIEEARRRASDLPAGAVLLGGERGGKPIEGFDLGNSPAEYTPGVVTGKTVVLTTTNGTRALCYCHEAREVLPAAFANLSAVCRHLLRGSDTDAERTIHLVCAGTDGQITREDVLLAGAIADRVAIDGSWQLDDPAEIARDAWRAVVGASDQDASQRLTAAMRESRGGRNLARIGMADDIAWAAHVDRFDLLPRFDPEHTTIEVAHQ